MSKMLLNSTHVFYVLFFSNFLFQTYIVSANNDIAIAIKSKFQTIGRDFIKSMTTLKSVISSFFKIADIKLSDKKTKIRNIVHSFIDKSLSDNDIILNISDGANIIKEDVSKMSTVRLIEHHGYRAKSHNLLTPDGYILTLHRVLPASEYESRSGNKSVLLHHGLLGSSADWILLGPNKSLPYMLLNEGYDVWLANARGNNYSKSHISTNVNSTEFWDFSWHEIGQFDLLSTIDFIRSINGGKTEISFIGHSLGATALLVLLSIYPQYNNILESAVLLAPLVFMHHAKGPLRYLSGIHNINGFHCLDLIGKNEFMSSTVFPSKIIERYCKGEKRLCLNTLLLLANGGKQIYDKSLMMNVLGHVPAGGSTKTIMHYCQLLRSKQFQMFDYGVVNNYKRYGSRTPPIYSLSDVTLPVAVFSSADDWLSTTADIRRLLPHFLNPYVHHVVRAQEFSHTDFVWGEDATGLLYNLILDFLQ